MNRLIPIVAILLVLPGCIAWEIRDEIRTTNSHLCEVQPLLVSTLHSVEETKQQVATANGRLAEVQAALVQTQSHLSVLHASMRQVDDHLTAVGGSLALTNPQLVNLDGGLERMKILAEIQSSLQQVNKSLEPLNSAIGTLGGAVSFLGLSSDNSRDLLAEEEAEAKPGADTAGAATDQAAGDKSKRPDPILGTWVMVYPPPTPPQTAGRIIVLMPDGKLIGAESGNPPQTGTWSRQGRSLTFTLDAVGNTPAPPPETLELLTLNTRTLTIKRGDTIRVHARP